MLVLHLHRSAQHKVQIESAAGTAELLRSASIKAGKLGRHGLIFRARRAAQGAPSSHFDRSAPTPQLRQTRYPPYDVNQGGGARPPVQRARKGVGL